MTSAISRYIKIGVAYEGNLDTSYVSALLAKILNELGYGISDMDIVQARTVITKFVPVYVNRFTDNNCDLMVFLTDSDDGANTVQDIRDKIETSKPEVIAFCAIGVAEPHLESWVIADEDSVKAVFNLNGAEPLPHPSMKPKDRLISICNSSDYEGTLDDAKITIANNANIQTMSRRCSDFNAFLQEVKAALNQLDLSDRAN
jgi:hypothetical protein